MMENEALILGDFTYRVDTSRAKCLSGVMVVVCDDFADQCVSDKFNISFHNVPPVTVKDNIYFLFL